VLLLFWGILSWAYAKVNYVVLTQYELIYNIRIRPKDANKKDLT